MIAISLFAALLMTTPVDEPKPKDDPNVALASPKPEYSPQQAVKLIFDALQKNDTPRENAGIETAFNFASPGNKKITGPLPKFITMVKSPNYAEMVDHKFAEMINPTRVEGDLAAQRVRVIGKNGKIITYEFILSRDKTTRCWMTDGVVIVPAVEA